MASAGSAAPRSAGTPSKPSRVSSPRLTAGPSSSVQARQSHHTDLFSPARMQPRRDGEPGTGVRANTIGGRAQGLSRTEGREFRTDELAADLWDSLPSADKQPLVEWLAAQVKAGDGFVVGGAGRKRG